GDDGGGRDPRGRGPRPRDHDDGAGSPRGDGAGDAALRRRRRGGGGDRPRPRDGAGLHPLGRPFRGEPRPEPGDDRVRRPLLGGGPAGGPDPHRGGGRVERGGGRRQDLPVRRDGGRQLHQVAQGAPAAGRDDPDGRRFGEDGRRLHQGGGAGPRG